MTYASRSVFYLIIQGSLKFQQHEQLTHLSLADAFVVINELLHQNQ